MVVDNTPEPFQVKLHFGQFLARLHSIISDDLSLVLSLKFGFEETTSDLLSSFFASYCSASRQVLFDNYLLNLPIL